MMRAMTGQRTDCEVSRKRSCCGNAIAGVSGMLVPTDTARRYMCIRSACDTLLEQGRRARLPLYAQSPRCRRSGPGGVSEDLSRYRRARKPGDADRVDYADHRQYLL